MTTSKGQRTENSGQEEQWTNFLLEGSDENDITDESEIENDHLSKSGHDTSCEEEYSYSEESTLDRESVSQFLIGKDGIPWWKKTKPHVNVWTWPHNIISDKKLKRSQS